MKRTPDHQLQVKVITIGHIVEHPVKSQDYWKNEHSLVCGKISTSLSRIGLPKFNKFGTLTLKFSERESSLPSHKCGYIVGFFDESKTLKTIRWPCLHRDS